MLRDCLVPPVPRDYLVQRATISYRACCATALCPASFAGVSTSFCRGIYTRDTGTPSEDTGIATYSMLLLRHSFFDETWVEDEQVEALDHELTSTPRQLRDLDRQSASWIWDVASRGSLLTYILVSEGYAGHGFSARARVFWYHSLERLHLDTQLA
ncbi:hypothetical protein BD626DRAFT_575679 [Schizophyllum amplum]|uniref:Uncharacterized protein n=1 Tax=Schizophyllum amplum TaxID=97359 RepID=A0A550BV71_9AGAR|nr:hypothetical protein BD626DRAFT_575679 [Auriculariopsis ampla]